MSKLSDDTLYAGGSFVGAQMVSIDNGQSWSFDTVIIPNQLKTIESENTIARPAPGQVLASMIYFADGIIAHGEISHSADVPKYRGTVTIYPHPNPVSTTLTFEVSDRRLSDIHVMDILGREVLVSSMPASGLVSLGVSGLPAGVYQIQNGQERARFVKE